MSCSSAAPTNTLPVPRIVQGLLDTHKSLAHLVFRELRGCPLRFIFSRWSSVAPGLLLLSSMASAKLELVCHFDGFEALSTTVEPVAGFYLHATTNDRDQVRIVVPNVFMAPKVFSNYLVQWPVGGSSCCRPTNLHTHGYRPGPLCHFLCQMVLAHPVRCP